MADSETRPPLPPRPISAAPSDTPPATTSRTLPATTPASTSTSAPAPAPTHAPAPVSPITSQHQPVSAPATAAATTTTTTTTNANTLPLPLLSSTPSKGFREKLDAGESHWRWKVGLRAFLIVVGLIGIGCTAFAITVARSEKGPFEYFFDDGWALPWTLITFSISVVWCAVTILVLLFRKAPVHPGVVVSMDLILWLAYIPTALFAVVAVLSVLNWGEGGRLGYYSSSGSYRQASNGTWIWNAGSSSSSSQRDCTGGDGYTNYYSSRYDSYGFKSCADQDAYVNSLWESKGHRAGVEITAVVCQFIGLVFHLALFVWACVDTHYRNSRKVSKDAEQLAADIVMNMVRSGAIIPPPSSTQRPPMQYAQPQQYPMHHPSSNSNPTHQTAQMQQPTTWAGGSAGPATTQQRGSILEKGKLPRYA